jgi:hypothetical protein
MASRIRKRLILERAGPVSEIASELVAALNRCADELAGIGGALAYIGAQKHSGTAGEQRLLGGVIYHTSVQRFGGVKYDGDPIDQMTIDDLARTFRKLMRKP